LKDTLYYLVQQLLIYNSIALDKKELSFQIQSHPSYPSLHAITGVLDHFNIDNIALDIPIDEATLAQLPKSFLARVKINQREEFAVIVKKGLYYSVILSKKKEDKLTSDEFLDIFTGIIVAVEKTELTEENNANTKLTNNSFITILSIVIFGLFFLAKPSLISTLFFFTSIIGILISITLKKQEQGIQTVLGNAFCSGASEFKDCDAVLTSKGANINIFGNYKLSDVSLIYFSGLAVTVFTSILLGLNLSLVFVISLLAFPITLYSIYYQAVVIKKWCLLCISIVAILWAQTVIVAFNFEPITSLSWSLNSILLIVLGFLSVLTIWNIIAPQLTDLQKLKQIKIDHFKFKRNFNLFHTLLETSKIIDTTINNASEIVFGNPNSNLELTIVTSPFCGHCKPVHTLVETILKKHSDKVKIIIRFSVNSNDAENILVKITSRVIELYNTEGVETCLNAMHKIYKGQEPESWITTFGVCNNKEYFLGILKKESEWCKENAINFTPEILINGKSFPKEYDRNDLIYFIEDLHENCCTEDIKGVQLAT
jgi:uncharacterized membrane protein